MKRALILLLVCLAAQATLVPALSLEGLIDQSEIIVHGRVNAAWPAWDSKHKYIWTHYRIEVIDPILGNPGTSLVVSEPGGALDGEMMTISGALNYTVGEEAVVFLYRTPIGYLRATGSGQGKYTVTPQMRVRANLKGLEMLKGNGSPGVPLSTLDGLTVAGFKARVREVIQSRR
jgi:hypothetical protein